MSATIIYSRGRSLAAPLIRAADRWGQWSHCGVVMPDASVVEARPIEGVVRSSLIGYVERSSHHAILQTGVPNEHAGYEWLLGQVGKGYDYLAILGNLARQSWCDDDRWQCAELVEAFLAACGRPRFREVAWRISPNLSWGVL